MRIRDVRRRATRAAPGATPPARSPAAPKCLDAIGRGNEALLVRVVAGPLVWVWDAQDKAVSAWDALLDKTPSKIVRWPPKKASTPRFPSG